MLHKYTDAHSACIFLLVSPSLNFFDFFEKNSEIGLPTLTFYAIII